MLGQKQCMSEFEAYAAMFAHTRTVLRNYWDRGECRSEEANFLATITLSHIDDIDTGFKWTLRTDEVLANEIRYVIESFDATDWAGEPSSAYSRPLAPDMAKVMALRHAQVVFGYLPRIPKPEVSYPGYTGYADIKVPGSTLELRERIRELAVGVWETAAQGASSCADPERARRVYGFFEAGAWLTNVHLRKMRHH